MDTKNEAQGSWINPLLSQLDLVKSKQDLVDFGTYWTQVEECRLPERIRKIVADVNGAAGYHVLELLDFLPPQRSILRIKFTKQRTEHVMEIVLHERGPAVKFYSLRKASDIWGGFFASPVRMRNRTTFFEQDIHPEEILDDNIQAWFSYLLSGFEKKFKPSAKEQFSEKSHLRLSAAAGKVSA